jgi:predicted kinase
VATLTITRGLPGSGKTTWARAQIGAVRVNRDDLRLMLHGTVGVGTNRTEGQVTTAHRAQIEALLLAGVDVICDDTNLRTRVVRELLELARKCAAEVVVRDFTDVSVEECVRRDAARTAPVGEDVIRGMYSRYLSGRSLPLPVPSLSAAAPGVRYQPPVGGTLAVLVDIDGTVALMDGRSPYDMTRVHHDRPNHAVIAAVRAMHAAGHRVIFCSGRTDDARAATEQWLARHVGVPVEGLFMRAVGDQRKDSIVKGEIFDRHIRGRYQIVGVFDDRAQVVRMWRALGLTVFQVADGDF